MNKEKQIEEMTNHLRNTCEGECFRNKDGRTDCDVCRACYLYEAGYRKQSEGEWEKTTEPMGWHDVDCVACSVCGESWVLNENLDFDLIYDYWHYCPNCGAKMKGGE